MVTLDPVRPEHAVALAGALAIHQDRDGVSPPRTDASLDDDTRPALRFITCGSVDDGKSTLIGRLLYDTKLILDDHLASAARASRRHGTVGDEIDLALLVDGLEAEREQGITIDVAYRYFTTPQRSFIVAEMLASTRSERQGRLIDHDETASMERKKREGYF